MGNFEKLSVLVIVVIIAMILVVALYTWSDSSDPAATATAPAPGTSDAAPFDEPTPPPAAKPEAKRKDAVPELEKKKSDLDTWLDWPPIPSKDGKTEPKGSQPTPPPPVPDSGKPAEPAGPQFTTYEVKQNDTLGHIAQEMLGGTSKYPEILKANEGLDPLKLRPGMKIKIPVKGSGDTTAKTSGGSTPSAGAPKPGDTYTVARGETLETIAKKVYGTKNRWPELWVSNLALLDDPGDIREGMRLSLPR